ncbi:hypothetical protein LK540_23020 [Massilia sp. IC2-278]|uniref:hypothetical protein n=1 Tax=Massilia sp. IC2-278 TaxID=2887200 RepID=UPI001E42EA39|nr:hypothetical protein [Massilia sp. IC2-278]MCC2963313.1 hypothetical protein [Massilia sp. IC2-278]
MAILERRARARLPASNVHGPPAMTREWQGKRARKRATRAFAHMQKKTGKQTNA